MTTKNEASAEGESTIDSHQADAMGHAHPSRSLKARSRGFGVAAGYEKPRQRNKRLAREGIAETYGPLPHAGYYGSGIGTRPFQRGQAGFSNELSWYGSQYGEKTSRFSKD